MLEPHKVLKKNFLEQFVGSLKSTLENSNNCNYRVQALA